MAEENVSVDSSIEILKDGRKDGDPTPYKGHCSLCQSGNAMRVRTRFVSVAFCKPCWSMVSIAGKKIREPAERAADADPKINVSQVYMDRFLKFHKDKLTHVEGKGLVIKDPILIRVYYFWTTSRYEHIKPYYTHDDNDYNARTDGEYVPTVGIEYQHAVNWGPRTVTLEQQALSHLQQRLGTGTGDDQIKKLAEN